MRRQILIDVGHVVVTSRMHLFGRDGEKSVGCRGGSACASCLTGMDEAAWLGGASLGMMRGAIMILGLKEGAFVAVVDPCSSLWEGDCVVDMREMDGNDILSSPVGSP